MPLFGIASVTVFVIMAIGIDRLFKYLYNDKGAEYDTPVKPVVLAVYVLYMTVEVAGWFING